MHNKVEIQASKVGFLIRWNEETKTEGSNRTYPDEMAAAERGGGGFESREARGRREGAGRGSGESWQLESGGGVQQGSGGERNRGGGATLDWKLHHCNFNWINRQDEEDSIQLRLLQEKEICGRRDADVIWVDFGPLFCGNPNIPNLKIQWLIFLRSVSNKNTEF